MGEKRGRERGGKKQIQTPAFMLLQSTDSFIPKRSIPCLYICFFYPTALSCVQKTPKTSTNITWYLYSRGPVRRVFSQHASDELD